jgi:AraC-like DNA-binding protein
VAHWRQPLRRTAVAARKLLALVQTGFPATDVHFAHQPARYSEFLELQQLFHRWLDAFVGIMENEGRIFMHIGSIDDRLMKAVRALKETPLEAPFPTEILQRETGLGRAHLDRLFYQSFGTTTRGYWDQRRLESARTILGTTRMPVKEMSFRLGFKQASHFTKWFQRLAGSTPISYRKTEYKPGARASASKPKTEGKSPTRSVRGGSVKRAPSRFQSK